MIIKHRSSRTPTITENCWLYLVHKMRFERAIKRHRAARLVRQALNGLAAAYIRLHERRNNGKNR
jgi:RNase P protein component